MFTTKDIELLNQEMTEEGFLGCSDMFIERLREKEADLVGASLFQEESKDLKNMREDINSGKDDRDFSE